MENHQNGNQARNKNSRRRRWKWIKKRERQRRRRSKEFDDNRNNARWAETRIRQFCWTVCSSTFAPLPNGKRSNRLRFSSCTRRNVTSRARERAEKKNHRVVTFYHANGHWNVSRQREQKWLVAFMLKMFLERLKHLEIICTYDRRQ